MLHDVILVLYYYAPILIPAGILILISTWLLENTRLGDAVIRFLDILGHLSSNE